MIKRKFFWALLCFFLAGQAMAQRTILHCGRLIDGAADQVQSRISIIIEGDKIVSVESGYARGGRTDKVIDLKDKTVMPGLMDMHVHIEGQSSPGSQVQRYTLNPADVAYNAQMYAERTLMAGFTTVRDLGGSGVNVALSNTKHKNYI